MTLVGKAGTDGSEPQVEEDKSKDKSKTHLLF